MMIERFLRLLPSNLPASPVILDVGSFTGEQACELASQFPTARIFAFEALPRSAEVVRRTVSRYPNIEVVDGAVCDTDGRITFHAVLEGNSGASSLFVGSGLNDVAPAQQIPMNVPALRLDTWAGSRNITSLDLVWMDLQGAELLALRGMGELLQTVRAIQVEITYRELYRGQVMWPEIRAFLESNGLVLADEWPDISGYWGDAIFVRP